MTGLVHATDSSGIVVCLGTEFRLNVPLPGVTATLGPIVNMAIAPSIGKGIPHPFENGSLTMGMNVEDP